MTTHEPAPLGAGFRMPCQAPSDPPRGASAGDPVEIHETLLEETRRAYLDDDEDAFVRLFVLPQTVVTQEGTRDLTTPEDVRAIFRHTHARFLALGVTDLIRVCIAAEFTAPDRIRATHVSYVLQGRKLVTEPYPNTGTLLRTDDGWKISSSEYGSTDPAWTTFDAMRNAPPEVDRGSLAAPDEDNSDRKDRR